MKGTSLTHMPSTASPEQLAERRRFAGVADEALWAFLVKDGPIPRAWRVYHRGELHEGGRERGLVARELYRRGLALLAQRRSKGIEGFDYLIVARAAPSPFVEEMAPVEEIALPPEPAPVVRPIIGGHAVGLQVQAYIAAFDAGSTVLEIASRYGRSYPAVYDALRRSGRIIPKAREPAP